MYSIFDIPAKRYCTYHLFIVIIYSTLLVVIQSRSKNFIVGTNQGTYTWTRVHESRSFKLYLDIQARVFHVHIYSMNR